MSSTDPEARMLRIRHTNACAHTCMHVCASTRAHKRTHTHTPICILHTQFKQTYFTLVDILLRDDKENQLLCVFPNVFSPIRLAKLQVFTTWSICENIGSKHYLHRCWKDSQNNLCGGEFGNPSKIIHASALQFASNPTSGILPYQRAYPHTK